MTTRAVLSSTDPLALPDLGAVVYRGGVPSDVAGRIAALYGSFRCSVECLTVFNRSRPEGACVLDEPPHVLVYGREGSSVEVLNTAFAIGPHEAARACRALFRALPGARRIHCEVQFPPEELGLPYWARGTIQHMSVALPGTVDGYDAMLGRSTRRRLRGYENRLRREHPDIAVESGPPGARSRELVDLLVAWKAERMRERGIRNYWDDDPRRPEGFAALVERLGEAHVTTIAGRPAAIVFTFPAGDTTCALEAAHDPRYERYDLGLLSLRDVLRDAARRGVKHVDLTTGDRHYKERLGGTLHQADGLSVFRRETDRLWSPREGIGVAVNWAKRYKDHYWSARHAARRVAERALGRHR